jgi:hypothetical protein
MPNSFSRESFSSGSSNSGHSTNTGGLGFGKIVLLFIIGVSVGLIWQNGGDVQRLWRNLAGKVFGGSATAASGEIESIQSAAEKRKAIVDQISGK